MVKKYSILFVSILFLYLGVSNKEGIHISSLELLATGYDNSQEKIQLYNYLLNIATMAIYISVIDGAISSTYRLRNYICTRGGHSKLIHCLMKTAMQYILVILLIKQIIYILFYLLSTSYTQFYIYDVISTFLTLSILSLVLISTKLQGWGGKNSLFTTISIVVIAQFLSYNYPIFSTFIIAAKGWNETQLLVLTWKSMAIIVMVYSIFFLSKPSKVLEGVEE